MNRADARRARVVIVTRRSLYTLLLERHGTAGQAAFYLRSRAEEIAPYEEAHERIEAALRRVDGALPADQRRTRVDRDDLERFLFAPDDIVVIVGQDGLVPNVAKYLRGQRVLGVNPDPERYDGVLCTHRSADLAGALAWTETGAGEFMIERRTMALAEREDGQQLLALNEVFIGHRTHQSARYRLQWNGRSERQSSSGIICATGTGATGWARSITLQRNLRDPLPDPESLSLAWFVREPFPSVATGTELDRGSAAPSDPLRVSSEMSDGGVIFADGIETDRVEFLSGQSVVVRPADVTLNLVVARARKQPSDTSNEFVSRAGPAPRPLPVRPRRDPRADKRSAAGGTHGDRSIDR